LRAVCTPDHRDSGSQLNDVRLMWSATEKRRAGVVLW
jgi:hypothetical protein